MNYPDKYHLTPEQNLFLAKKRWDENVYCGMRMEARAVTFPQTQTILHGVNVPNVSLDDIQAILNMRDAWRFLIATVNEPLTLDYICKLNENIARNEALVWGKLRTGAVGISGTDYLPPIPEREKVESELSEILNSDRTATEKSLDLFAWCIKVKPWLISDEQTNLQSQNLTFESRVAPWWDGNKRTGLTAANKLMVSSGAGMLTITDKYMDEFNTELLNFYNSGDPKPLKDFMYANTIIGMTV